ncbi:MAG: hypothetical protein V4731_10735 [Pseudomonadota bacterium]
MTYIHVFALAMSDSRSLFCTALRRGAALLLATLALPALAAITASPSILNFTQQVTQTAAAQIITVVNNSGAPVNFNGAQFSPPGFFTLSTLSTTCFTGQVANNSTCTVAVRPVAQTLPGSSIVNFNLLTLQFGSLPVADAVLNLLVTSGSSPTPSGPGSLSSVSPGQVALATGGRSSRLITYSFDGAASTPVGSFVCSQLVAPPIHGATTSNPCAPGAQSFALTVESSGFTAQPVVGGRSRASETVAFPEAFARLSSALARASGNSSLYFVRQFQNGNFAVVQLQALGSSLADPLTLTDVRMFFRTGRGRQPTVTLSPGEAVPPSIAEIDYTGSGTLRGRWEVVEPGLPAPSPSDLVPEASVVRSERGMQRRYRLVERFEYSLGPTGRFELPGPDPARLPVRLNGGYFLLLRIEAVPAGNRSGASAEDGAAAFSMPVLVYQVGTGIDGSTALASRFVNLIDPPAGSAPAIAWRPIPEARSWRVELANDAGVIVGSKFLRAGETSYRLGGALARQTRGKAIKWRVQAFDAGRKPIGRSDWAQIPRS